MLGPPQYPDWVRLPEGGPESCNLTRGPAKLAHRPNLKTEKAAGQGAAVMTRIFALGDPSPLLPEVHQEDPPLAQAGKCGSSKGPGVFSLLTQKMLLREDKNPRPISVLP